MRPLRLLSLSRGHQNSNNNDSLLLPIIQYRKINIVSFIFQGVAELHLHLLGLTHIIRKKFSVVFKSLGSENSLQNMNTVVFGFSVMIKDGMKKETNLYDPASQMSRNSSFSCLSIIVLKPRTASLTFFSLKLC